MGGTFVCIENSDKGFAFHFCFPEFIRAQRVYVIIAETHNLWLHLHRCEQLDLVHTQTEEVS